MARALAVELVRAQEEERRRIAVDLHDDAVQLLTLLRLRLEMLRGDVGDAALAARLEGLEGIAERCTKRLRHVLFDLSPPVLERGGLAAAVHTCLERLFEDTPVRWCVLDHLGDRGAAEPKIIAYRIVQEALANVRKHADCEEVRVVLEDSAGGIRVQVTDDGIGFSPDLSWHPAPGHLGLAAARQRAEAAGGWLRVESEAGVGTVVEAWVPGALGAEIVGATAAAAAPLWEPAGGAVVG